VDFLVNLSALPGSDSARQMTVRSGLKCCELLGKPSPLGSLVKTLLESSQWNSTISFLTWKTSATPRGRLLFRLVPSMPDTEGTEFGSSQDAMWRTPQASEAGARVETLYTKDGNPARPGERAYRKQPDGRMVLQSVTIGQQVKMWPTPTANDDRDRGSAASGAVKRRIEKGKQVMLSQSVSTVNGSLNPNWVEWLMGYPIGHTACAGWVTPSSRKSPKKSYETSSIDNQKPFANIQK